jgi:predicted short-subunit dehydrogenase-like oxidoreductase (DUF2520 family)
LPEKPLRSRRGVVTLAFRMKRTLSIVGAGRVGRTLGRRLHELGWHIGAVVTRSRAHSRAAVRVIGAGTPMRLGGTGGIYFREGETGSIRDLALDLNKVFAADVLFFTTSDDILPSLARAFARLAGEKCRGRIVLHTSATLDRGALAPFARFGAAVGSLHPMQAFGGSVMPNLENVIFAVEGDSQAVRVAESIAKSLGGIPVAIASGDKALYHAAAVMAAGSMYATIEAGLQLLMRAGFTRERAGQTLFPLLRQIFDNIERLGPRAAWTGPLSRGDYEIVARHARALRTSSPQIREAYAALAMLAASILSGDPQEAKKRTAQALDVSRPRLPAPVGRLRSLARHKTVRKTGGKF